MNNLSTSVNSSLEWRRNKVQGLASQDYNQSEISKILQISQPTINRVIWNWKIIRTKYSLEMLSFLCNVFFYIKG